MGRLIDVDDAIKAIQGLPRWILDPKGEFQPVEPPTKSMIDPDDAVAAIENLPLAKPGFDSVVKLDKAFDDGYKQGYLQAESDLSISQPHENDRLNNQVHLCNSCKYDFPDCPSKNDDIVLGNGVGNDNVCACAKYSHSVSEDILEKMSQLLVEWLMESDFGYDNLGDLYDKYKDDIKSMSYSDGLVYIAKMEALRDG